MKRALESKVAQLQDTVDDLKHDLRHTLDDNSKEQQETVVKIGRMDTKLRLQEDAKSSLVKENDILAAKIEDLGAQLSKCRVEHAQEVKQLTDDMKEYEQKMDDALIVEEELVAKVSDLETVLDKLQAE